MISWILLYSLVWKIWTLKSVYFLFLLSVFAPPVFVYDLNFMKNCLLQSKKANHIYLRFYYLLFEKS